jgi:hypothetical protein
MEALAPRGLAPAAALPQQQDQGRGEGRGEQQR